MEGKKEKRKEEGESGMLPPLDVEGLVVPIFLGANDVDIGVDAGLGGRAGAARGLSDFLGHGVQGRRRRRRASERGGGEAAEGESLGEIGGAEGRGKGGMGKGGAEEKEQSIAREGVEMEGP